MNQLTNPNYLKDLFRHYSLKPKDYLGQNFLVDEIALDEIVSAGDLKKSDTVLEVGPGLGVLTQQLAQRAGRVVAVEKDRTLLEILNFNLEEFKNVEVVNKDILKFRVEEKIEGRYKVLANIPYYLTSHLIQFFLGQKNKPELMVFLVQKEVGERVTASAGDLTVLGISVQAYSNPEIIAQVPRRSFWPSPKVDSVVLKIVPAEKYPIKDDKEFFRLVKIGFSAKRKQLHNNLGAGLKKSSAEIKSWLASNGIGEASRAEDLSIEQWVKLYQNPL